MILKMRYVVFILILIFCTVFVSADSQYLIQEFTNCNNYSINVDVYSTSDLIQGEYELLNCNKLNSSLTVDSWSCLCLDSLNLTLNSFFGSLKSYFFHFSYVLDDEYNTSISEHTALRKPNENHVHYDDLSPNFLLNNKFTILSFAVTLLIAVFLFFLIRYFIFEGLPWNNSSKKAKLFHLKGQRAYHKGNHKKAEMFYKQAAKYRNK